MRGGHRVFVCLAHGGEIGVGQQQRGEVGRDRVARAGDRVVPACPVSHQLVRMCRLHVDKAVLDKIGEAQAVAVIGPPDGQFHPAAARRLGFSNSMAPSLMTTSNWSDGTSGTRTGGRPTM